MDKKKKIIIAVSAVAAVAVIVAVVIAATNSSDDEKYTNNTVVEIVTDENGEAVTDENGDVVTVVSEKASASASDSTAGNSNGNSASGSDDSTSNTAGNGNTSNQNGGGNSGAASDTTAGSTAGENNDKDEPESEKPKARNVTVDIVLPYYNKQETEITILYKAEGDSKYSKLEPVKVKLDKSGKKESFDLGELKGAVDVTVTFSGIKITENSITISASENTGTIRPATGIEILEGEDD